MAGASHMNASISSNPARAARLDAIRIACQEYIRGPLLAQIETLLQQALTAAGLPTDRRRVELDTDGPDGQSLLLRYPSVTAVGNDYIRRTVKIEAGAKSALDPHAPVTLRPFIADDLASGDLSVRNVTTGDPKPLKDRITRLMPALSRLHEVARLERATAKDSEVLREKAAQLSPAVLDWTPLRKCHYLPQIRSRSLPVLRTGLRRNCQRTNRPCLRLTGPAHLAGGRDRF